MQALFFAVWPSPHPTDAVFTLSMAAVFCRPVRRNCTLMDKRPNYQGSEKQHQENWLRLFNPNRKCELGGEIMCANVKKRIRIAPITQNTGAELFVPTDIICIAPNAKRGHMDVKCQNIVLVVEQRWI